MEPPDRVVPGASALLESLRGIGYFPWTSVADLVDNSIAASARRIRVDFVWQGSSSYAYVLDDGDGMDEVALIRAMRPGSRSPTEVRAANDLGRFGLGLKTASLAQCRVLTVVSKRNGLTAARRWDLDYIAEQDDWLLLKGLPEDIYDRVAIPDDFQSGTLVLWTKLDRLVGAADIDDLAARARFLEIARHVEFHLAMTFHRFLEGPRPQLELFFNGNKVKPWDPFMQGHLATTSTPLDRISYAKGSVKVQGFVLPHKDRLTSDELEDGAGPEGWLAHQGFFVYRNERLLVPGGWLGLGRSRKWVRDEIHRLARIRIDLPNSSDDDWKIDIKKSVAFPPSNIRDRLQGLAERIRADAREVFTHRGGKSARTSTAIVRAWTSVETKQGISYRIDRGHPSIKQVLDSVGKQRRIIEEMLRVIEATVPVQRIWLDVTEKGDLVSAVHQEIDSDLIMSLRALYRHMLDDLHLAPEEARSRLARIEPFNQFPAVLNALSDNE
jgi:hypothetical protein